MERSVDALRARGDQLRDDGDDARRTASIEAEGHVVGGRAILRLREVSGIKCELAELQRAPPEA